MPERPDSRSVVGGYPRKPTPDDRVRELVKAGALIAAEIDRLQAAADGSHAHG